MAEPIGQIPSVFFGGWYNATPPILTDRQQVGAQFDINGNLLVAGTLSASITGAVGIKGADGSTIASVTNSFPTQAISVSGALQETTIAAGGTAQDLFSGATPANGFEIVNPPSATETLYFREANTATVAGAASMPIVVGGSYVSPSGYKPTGRISVIATTTSHPVIARRW